MRKLLLLALLLVFCNPASAFGSEGHRLVAAIAEHFLTPAAKQQIQQTLKSESDCGVSVVPPHHAGPNVSGIAALACRCAELSACSRARYQGDLLNL